MNAPRLATTFSGIEGFGLGFTLAGWSLERVSEIDKHANKVLAERFPGAENGGDITQLPSEWLGHVDCYAFGFPCQDLSVAGHRAGLTGTRSGLFWESIRLIAAQRPKWIVAENVPGLLSSNQGQDFGNVLWALASLGYGVAYAVLDAQHFGVPQRRRRVFIVGCLGDPASARKVLADAPGGFRHPDEGQREGSDASDGVEGGPRNPLYYTHDYSQDRIFPAEGSAQALTSTKRELYAVGCPGEPDRGRGGSDADAPGSSQAWLGSSGHQGQDGNALGPTESSDNGRQRCSPDAAGTDGGRRLREPCGSSDEHGPSTTPIDAPGNGAPPGLPRWLDLPMWRDDEGARALCLDREATGPDRREEGGQASHSPKRGAMDGGSGAVARRSNEAESNIDDGHGDGGPGGVCDCPDTPRYRATGNAVAVPVAYWIARRICLVEAGVI